MSPPKINHGKNLFTWIHTHKRIQRFDPSNKHSQAFISSLNDGNDDDNEVDQLSSSTNSTLNTVLSVSLA